MIRFSDQAIVNSAAEVLSRAASLHLGLALATALGMAPMAAAAPEAATVASYSTPVGQDYPKNLYWGDTHLHTRNSADAYALGNMSLSPADAFRYARGEALTAHKGMRVQLRRPLDFLVISDHAEYLQGFYRFFADDPLVTRTPAGRQWLQFRDSGDMASLFGAFVASMQAPDDHPPFPETTRRLIWQDVAKTADDHNRPGRFTAFIGYEWTSMIDGNNLHRVVIYKDGAETAGQMPPFSGQDLPLIHL